MVENEKVCSTLSKSRERNISMLFISRAHSFFCFVTRDRFSPFFHIHLKCAYTSMHFHCTSNSFALFVSSNRVIKQCKIAVDSLLHAMSTFWPGFLAILNFQTCKIVKDSRIDNERITESISRVTINKTSNKIPNNYMACMYMTGATICNCVHMCMCAINRVVFFILFQNSLSHSMCMLYNDCYVFFLEVAYYNLYNTQNRIFL